MVIYKFENAFLNICAQDIHSTLTVSQILSIHLGKLQTDLFSVSLSLRSVSFLIEVTKAEEEMGKLSQALRFSYLALKIQISPKNSVFTSALPFPHIF